VQPLALAHECSRAAFRERMVICTGTREIR
jgi:hypothetical protein